MFEKKKPQLISINSDLIPKWDINTMNEELQKQIFVHLNNHFGKILPHYNVGSPIIDKKDANCKMAEILLSQLGVKTYQSNEHCKRDCNTKYTPKFINNYLNLHCNQQSAVVDHMATITKSQPFSSFLISDILSEPSQLEIKPEYPENIPNNYHNSFVVRRTKSSIEKREDNLFLEREIFNKSDNLSHNSKCQSEPIGNLSPSASFLKTPNQKNSLDELFKLTSNTISEMKYKDDDNDSQKIKNVEPSTRRKRRKCRTAFSSDQINQLERRFLYQKYLTPHDRDQIAKTLQLSNTQVITWFQNRRAKLKRDIEEIKTELSTMKNDSILPIAPNSSVILQNIENVLFSMKKRKYCN
ncbi:Ladybird homeobox protein 2 [Intoshia linei]|uniref:Ladybird homeobox protein 2 n=1 Tax=Intoshia linei TaxID=1819745 RepID=A0A177AXH6_9BILA|nr:Ladybird homeobox protein 2 [Intoshia linei]